jgi:hypothetical protein
MCPLLSGGRDRAIRRDVPNGTGNLVHVVEKNSTLANADNVSPLAEGNRSLLSIDCNRAIRGDVGNRTGSGVELGHRSLATPTGRARWCEGRR